MSNLPFNFKCGCIQINKSKYLNLQEYIRRTSEALYIATKPVSARSFGDVNILLPRSWPPISQCKSVSTENQNEANFIVEKDTTLWGSNPHTQKIDSQCGNPGKVTYLPRSFVVDLNEARKYGENIGKIQLKFIISLSVQTFSGASFTKGSAKRRTLK